MGKGPRNLQRTSVHESHTLETVEFPKSKLAGLPEKERCNRVVATESPGSLAACQETQHA